MSEDVHVSNLPCSEVNYHVINAIGAGAFGDVLRVKCSSDGKEYAVKVMQYGREETADKIIQNESRILAQLRHKNIVNMIDLFTVGSPNVLWLLIDYADFGNIETYVQMSGSLIDAALLSFTKQLCTAIVYIHSKDYTHGDVTPRNILLTSDMVLKLGDFGQALCVRDKDGREALCNNFIGDPRYLAPEVFKKTSYRGQPADIWSLGCCIYFMFTSKHLFSGSEKDIRQSHLRNKISFPGETFYYEDYLHHRDIIQKLINYDPAMRLLAQQAYNHQLFLF